MSPRIIRFNSSLIDCVSSGLSNLRRWGVEVTPMSILLPQLQTCGFSGYVFTWGWGWWWRWLAGRVISWWRVGWTVTCLWWQQTNTRTPHHHQPVSVVETMGFSCSRRNVQKLPVNIIDFTWSVWADLMVPELLLLLCWLLGRWTDTESVVGFMAYWMAGWSFSVVLYCMSQYRD